MTTSIKRPRQALSCSECRKRKVKCNQEIPCASCIQRGEIQKCHRDDPNGNKDNAASKADLDDLKQQVTHLENLIRSFAANSNGNAEPSKNSSINLLLNTKTIEDDASSVDSEAEHTAVAIESAAFGIGLPSASRPPPRSHAGKPFKDYTEGILSKVSNKVRDAGGNPLHPETMLNHLNGDIQTDSCFLPFPFTIGSRTFHSTELVRMMPSTAIARQLVDLYILDHDWIHHYLHVPHFRRQCEFFWSLSPNYRLSSYDFAWLAIYLSALATVVRVFTDKQCSDMGVNKGNAKDWQQGAQMALTLSEFMTKTSIEHLQAVPLVSKIDENWDAQWSMFAIAVRSAQSLGIHRLGSVKNGASKATLLKIPSYAKLDALPPIMGHKLPLQAAAEMGRRTWWNLVFSDWVMGSESSNVYMAHEGQFDTDIPMNADDEDLTEDGVTARPVHRATNMSYHVFRYRFAEMRRRQIDFTNSNGHIPYAKVGELEAYLRNMDAEAPPFLHITNPTTGQIVLEYPEDALIPALRWQRSIWQFSIVCFIAKLYRPYLVQGYTDLRYRKCQQTCIESALQALRIQRVTRDSPGHRWKVMMYHAFSAAIVLLIDLLYLRGKGPEAETKRYEVQSLVEWYHTIQDKAPVARRCAQLLEAILAEEREKAEQGTTKRSANDSIDARPQKRTSSITDSLPGISNSPSSTTPLTPAATTPDSAVIDLGQQLQRYDDDQGMWTKMVELLFSAPLETMPDQTTLEPPVMPFDFGETPMRSDALADPQGFFIW